MAPAGCCFTTGCDDAELALPPDLDEEAALSRNPALRSIWAAGPAKEYIRSGGGPIVASSSVRRACGLMSLCSARDAVAACSAAGAVIEVLAIAAGADRGVSPTTKLLCASSITGSVAATMTWCPYTSAQVSRAAHSANTCCSARGTKGGKGSICADTASAALRRRGAVAWGRLPLFHSTAVSLGHTQQSATAPSSGTELSAIAHHNK